FPRGTDFPEWATQDFVAPDLSGLPEAGVQAFSVDDETTTEIDDCLSMQALSNGRLRLGVHIAVPALGIRAGDPLDKVARERMTTVYSPGSKITMLPEPVVRAYSLDAGTERPALPLYVDVEPANMQVLVQVSAVHRTPRAPQRRP